MIQLECLVKKIEIVIQLVFNNNNKKYIRFIMIKNSNNNQLDILKVKHIINNSLLHKNRQNKFNHKGIVIFQITALIKIIKYL